jgi:hypothetical protein
MAQHNQTNDDLNYAVRAFARAERISIAEAWKVAARGAFNRLAGHQKRGVIGELEGERPRAYAPRPPVHPDAWDPFFSNDLLAGADDDR